jgi:hypothetical protein
LKGVYTDSRRLVMIERSTSFGSAGTLGPPLCDPRLAPASEGSYAHVPEETVKEEVSFKEEMKAEPKESSPLLSSPEKTPRAKLPPPRR